ncbi:CU044_5270 family protein [Streptomyces sp. NPDC003631]|uniref:CU044_5270 family protein n=1 Tax=unclassified Streptomyces TaxID=2593676 RepID=UPI0034380B46
MTTHDTRRSQARRTDADEIAGLLPAPAEWDVPREQYLHRKELLMRQIDRDQALGHAQTTPSTRPSRRLLRPAVMVPVTALAMGAVALTVVTATGNAGHSATAGPSQHATTSDTMRPAAALLGRISQAALKTDAIAVHDDQFTYRRAKIREADLTTNEAVVGPLRDMETWESQKQGPQLKLGVVRVDGETFPINAELGDEHGTPAGLSRPTYRWLAALPTDPDKLLTYLDAKTPKTAKVRGQGHNQAVFEQIGSLIGEVMPPQTAAALYQAAARIPGVEPAPQAHDAIGRRGVGIARDDAASGTRTEWIFDKDDLALLGTRSYLIKDTSYGKKGTLLSSSAVLEHAVVDKAGQEPTRNSAHTSMPSRQNS